MSKSSRANTAMNVYAVVSKTTGNVVAKYLHQQGKLVLNGLKMSIMNYHDDHDVRVVLDVVEVYLSSNLRNIELTKALEIDSFAIDDGEMKLLFLSRDPARDIRLCKIR